MERGELKAPPGLLPAEDARPHARIGSVWGGLRVSGPDRGDCDVLRSYDKTDHGMGLPQMSFRDLGEWKKVLRTSQTLWGVMVSLGAPW